MACTLDILFNCKVMHQVSLSQGAQQNTQMTTQRCLNVDSKSWGSTGLATFTLIDMDPLGQLNSRDYYHAVYNLNYDH